MTQTYPLEPCDLEAAVVTVPWTEQLRHKILLLRLQRPYFIYCLLCSLLAAAAFLSTLVDLWKSGRFWKIPEGGLVKLKLQKKGFPLPSFSSLLPLQATQRVGMTFWRVARGKVPAGLWSPSRFSPR